MGAYSPAPVMTPEIERRALDEIVLPDHPGHEGNGNTPIRACSMPRLMITEEGPKLIEYNVSLRRSGMSRC